MDGGDLLRKCFILPPFYYSKVYLSFVDLGINPCYLRMSATQYINVWDLIPPDDIHTKQLLTVGEKRKRVVLLQPTKL